jgi:hypothetical protein
MVGRNPTPPNLSRRRLGEGGSLRRGWLCLSLNSRLGRERVLHSFSEGGSAAAAADPEKGWCVNLSWRLRLRAHVFGMPGDREGRACLSETAEPRTERYPIRPRTFAEGKSVGPTGEVIADDPAVSERRALPYAGRQTAI